MMSATRHVTSEDENFEDEIGQRKQSAVTTVNDILRFITPEENYIFENYDELSNVSSDLSNPFSDFEGANFHKEQKTKVIYINIDIRICI